MAAAELVITANGGRAMMRPAMMRCGQVALWDGPPPSPRFSPSGGSLRERQKKQLGQLRFCPGVTRCTVWRGGELLREGVDGLLRATGVSQREQPREGELPRRQFDCRDNMSWMGFDWHSVRPGVLRCCTRPSLSQENGDFSRPVHLSFGRPLSHSPRSRFAHKALPPQPSHRISKSASDWCATAGVQSRASGCVPQRQESRNRKTAVDCSSTKHGKRRRSQTVEGI